MEGDTDWERAHWIGGGRHRLAESALDKGGGGGGMWRETPTERERTG